MKTKITFIILIICLLSACSGEDGRQPEALSLWYVTPAANWEEALPIGNGHLGAMVYGKTDDELLQLNDNTLYSGEPATAYKGLDITKTYDELVDLLRKEKYAEASVFLNKNWLCKLHQNYQPLGDLRLKINTQGEITDYRRELDISNAVLRISYKQNGVGYVREIFASHPDDVIVMRLTSDEKGAIDVTASLSSLHPTAKQHVTPDGTIAMSGQAPGYAERRSFENIEGWGFQNKHPELYNPDGTRKFNKRVLYGDEINGMGTFFETRVKTVAKKGSLLVGDSGLHVSGTDEVVFVLSSATSFNGFDKSPSREGVDAAAIVEETMNKVKRLSYNELKKRHTADFTALFSRVSLELPVTPEQKSLPTNERICRNVDIPDYGLIPLVFQYGRYLMISGSRPGSQPLNLQGMWNDQIIPPWNGAYTININIQMNYWLAELTNLSECHEPFFRLAKETAISGAETARDMYHRRGWVAHHNVSIWRETYPNDGSAIASYWPMTAPWFCSHLWEHYLFTGDETFLRDEAYPLMKGASEFYADWLVDNGEGFLVTPVSTSPENQFYTADGAMAWASMGATMDMSMIRELFTRTITASSKLGVDAELRGELQEKLSKLLPYRIGAKGQLQEWQKDFAEPEPEHRHLSHLYGLYPGNQVADPSSDLARAISRTLDIRKISGGWSTAWKISLWARLLDAEKANVMVNSILKPARGVCESASGGNLHKNLWCSGSYQVDAGFGFTAGVTEMLLQSHAGCIQLLPALPFEWGDGKVTGLRTRGGFIVDMEWKGGKLLKARITSTLGGNCRLRTYEPVTVSGVQLSDASGVNPNPLFDFIDPGKPQNQTGAILKEAPAIKSYTVDFMTTKGATYEIKIKENS